MVGSMGGVEKVIIKLTEPLTANPGDYLVVAGEKVKVVKAEVMELAMELADLRRMGDPAQPQQFPLLAQKIEEQKEQQEKAKGARLSQPVYRATRKELMDRRTLLVAALSSYKVHATAEQLASYAYGPKVTLRQKDEFGRDLRIMAQLGLVDKKAGSAPPQHGGIPPSWFKLKDNLGMTNEQIVEKVMAG